MKISQHQDPAGYYFEFIVPGATPDALERGVKAAWDFFLAAHVHPWDAAGAEHQADTWQVGDPPIEDKDLLGMWTACQHLAIEACCGSLEAAPDGWYLHLIEPAKLPA